MEQELEFQQQLDVELDILLTIKIFFNHDTLIALHVQNKELMDA